MQSHTNPTTRPTTSTTTSLSLSSPSCCCNVRLIVVGFASHVVWAEGYQKAVAAAAASGATATQPPPRHKVNVRVTIVNPERWKWRMQIGAVELMDYVKDEDDIIVVDGMLDATPLVALLASKQQPQQQPRPSKKVVVYCHENQLTTPFTSQDRDAHRRNTHWHYGMAHYRSLFASDGFIFNTWTHLRDFGKALLALIQEQCPRDTVEWHLNRAQVLLKTKCTVLTYGLALHELLVLPRQQQQQSVIVSSSNDTATATAFSRGNNPTAEHVILWNARLEEDKDPETFLDILDKVRRRCCCSSSSSTKATTPSKQQPQVWFRLIVLGTDPTKEQYWYQRIRTKFTNELLFVGFCHCRTKYSYWLQQATIVLSTAQHETFGISVVESVYCGCGTGTTIVPLLPNRLSYPEIFNPQQFPNVFYHSTEDCITKLVSMITVQPQSTQQQSTQQQQQQQQLQAHVAKYDWSYMKPIYDHFFYSIVAHNGMDIVQAGLEAKARFDAIVVSPPTVVTMTKKEEEEAHDDENKNNNNNNIIMITDPNDSRTALYRPKSLRNHKEYNHQVFQFRRNNNKNNDNDNNNDDPPSLHGGRRAMVRMLEALSKGATCIRPYSFLTTHELADKILVPHYYGSTTTASSTLTSSSQPPPPIYVASDHQLLNEIRGQKLNTADAVLSVVRFPIACPSLDDILGNPPILMLEDVTNAENVGSILRTAFCLGITSIVASDSSWSALRDTRAARCSMGTVYYHRYYQTNSVVATIQQLQEIGNVTVYGIEIGDGAIPIRPHYQNNHDDDDGGGGGGQGDKKKCWAAVLANENDGMTMDTRQACSQLVYIPQISGDSLNVGHAAAIALYELGRHSHQEETANHDGRGSCS